MTDPHVQIDDSKLAMRVSRRSIYINLLLTVFKLAAGLIARSSAMVSDAIHSGSDVFSTLIVMIGVRISGRKADGNHRYGHERLESVAAILLAVVLAGTGLWIGYGGLYKVFAADYTTLAIPGMLALIAAILSILVKEGMFWYTKRAADRIHSAALMADAWHHRSDALSSIGSLVGILGARLGFPVLDPLASLVICVFILKAAYDIFMSAVRQLVDQSADPEVEQAMAQVIEAQDGVLQLDLLRTRQFGSRLYLDVEIAADGNQTLFAAHHIAEQVHDQIEASFPAVKHCMVHVNPLEVPQPAPGTDDGTELPEEVACGTDSNEKTPPV
ncbi:MAG: cation diffusion facilitator family transporter [Candidatus Onthomonas sp.]|nr:cation diffusion facilitator family transporter [Candidatus Onthomonas sp.]